MPWTQLNFVNAGDEVNTNLINQIIGNLREDDVAKVSQRGDLIVADGANSGARLAVGFSGQVLRSNTSEMLKMEWVSSSALSGNFVTWAGLRTHLGIS